jgi:hypothetical protein
MLIYIVQLIQKDIQVSISTWKYLYNVFVISLYTQLQYMYS